MKFGTGCKWPCTDQLATNSIFRIVGRFELPPDRAEPGEGVRCQANLIFAAIHVERGIGDEVGEAVIDGFLFRPDRRIETCRQTGFELVRRQAGDASNIALACAVIGTACSGVPVAIGNIASFVLANKPTQKTGSI